MSTFNLLKSVLASLIRTEGHARDGERGRGETSFLTTCGFSILGRPFIAVVAAPLLTTIEMMRKFLTVGSRSNFWREAKNSFRAHSSSATPSSATAASVAMEAFLAEEYEDDELYAEETHEPSRRCRR